MIKILLAFLVSFVVSIIIMPGMIKFFRQKSAGQTILGYVENHKDKNGTTTMGGVLFMIVLVLLSFIFIDYDTGWFMVLLVSLFFGMLGLMDDFLKVKYRQNLGLRPYQKIVGQLGISIIFATFVYIYSGGGLSLPFSLNTIEIRWLIIPLVIVVLIATTNSVNLTDGLDGLAGSTTLVYLIFFTACTSIYSYQLYHSGETGSILSNISNINTLSMLLAGSILGFLMFNTSKASIFMGDVGSLCLGGYIGASACLIGEELILPILGFCFVWSSVSVILQVASFKLRKKRIFKMAPFHHHLQMSGLSEPKIVAIYTATTTMIGIICTICYLM